MAIAGGLALGVCGLWAQRAEASGCKTGSEVYERAQFGTDLGLTLGGGAVAATGRFSILQVRRDPWVPAIDRSVPVDPTGNTEIASDVLVFSSYAAAAGWGIYVTVRCNREYTLRRSVATPLLEVAWPFLWTYGIGEVTKSFVGRPRPYTRGSEGFVDERDDFRSFFSGHTSTSAVMTALTVSSVLRFAPGKLSAPWVRAVIGGGAGLAYGLTTGSMRVLSAKHHWSDVLVGASVGASIGLLPIATERIGQRWGDDATVAVGPWPAGRGAAVQGRF